MDSFLTKIDGEDKPVSITTRIDQVLFGLGQEVRAITQANKVGNIAENMAGLLSKLNYWKDSITKFTDVLKNEALEILKQQGNTTTDKGSLSFQIGGYELRARPVRTGIDPKKLEVLLRKKQVDTGIAMDMEIKLIPNTDKIAYCLSESILTQEELDSCKYDLNYAVLPPIKL